MEVVFCNFHQRKAIFIKKSISNIKYKRLKIRKIKIQVRKLYKKITKKFGSIKKVSTFAVLIQSGRGVIGSRARLRI